MPDGQARVAEGESQLILILDDDVMVTEALALGLEHESRTIITCNDVESAQLIVERIKPSHIVADVRMSGPFGFEGLDFIRYAKKHTPESRVILMTGDAPEALQLEAAERGAVAFLRKPFEVQELESILNMMISSALTAAASGSKIIRMPLLDEIVVNDALTPHFQPVVSLSGERPCFGYEALARYRTDSPARNPDFLFKYATRKNRIGDLELACTRRSLQIGAKLAARGPLFLNIHPEVFSAVPDFPKLIIDQAAKTGVPLDRIVLEITEQGSLGDEPAVLHTIHNLQSHGIRFAFDDLGVAYSHLALIDKVRPSFLKVSQHFGTAFETDSTKMKIVMNLLSLARDFDSDLILEGIESQSTAEAAADLRIPFGQGFFFGYPEDVSHYLKD